MYGCRSDGEEEKTKQPTSRENKERKQQQRTSCEAGGGGAAAAAVGALLGINRSCEDDNEIDEAADRLLSRDKSE